MPRELTEEHKAAMAAGRERQLAEDRAARLDAEAAYSAWVSEDARVWRAYIMLDEDDGGVAYRAWADNLRRMPRLP